MAKLWMSTGAVSTRNRIDYKKRSQFRVASRNITAFYETVETVAVRPERGSVSRSRWGEATDEPARGMAREDARPTRTLRKLLRVADPRSVRICVHPRNLRSKLAHEDHFACTS